MVLATKGGIMPPLPYDQSADYLRSAIDASLARLKVDSVDLWQVHRPDILTHPQEVARTLTPPLSTMRIDRAEYGRQAAKLVLERLAQPSQPSRTILFPVEFLRRASVRET